MVPSRMMRECIEHLHFLWLIVYSTFDDDVNDKKKLKKNIISPFEYGTLHMASSR